MDLTIQQIMTLTALASKACEHEEKFIRVLFPDEMNMSQVKSAIIEAKKVLADLDTRYPGMLPLPHDGIPWSKRPS